MATFVTAPGGLSTKRVPELDGVRGLAILAVIACHSTNVHGSSVLSQGWIGVDLFFVLSGFLITSILLQSRGSDGFYSRFYARRILRIWPLYFVVLGVWGIGLAFHPANCHMPRMGWLSYVFFVQNFYISRVGWDTTPGALSPTWSLAIEEQFYLVWPLLVARLSKRHLARVCGALLIAGPIVRAFTATFYRGVDGGYLLTLCHVDGICVGALVALWMNSEDFSLRKFRTASKFALASVPVAIALLLVQGWPSRMFLYSSLAIAFAALLAFSFEAPQDGIVVRAYRSTLRFAPLRYAGVISYGLYLTHDTVFELFTSRLLRQHIPAAFRYDWARWPGLIVQWTVLFVIATLSWKLFESPILSLKVNYPQLATKLFGPEPAVGD